ncbi:DUF5994 family protein [Streptomyces flaveus]|uniref:DUF5994 family protein n=1 Tax=Streptomyces flaveus TaxID=66370 RepID=UPI00332F60C0
MPVSFSAIHDTGPAHTVKAAWFVTGLDPVKIRLFSYGVGHRDLLVIPPATDAASAARFIAAATDPRHRERLSWPPRTTGPPPSTTTRTNGAVKKGGMKKGGSTRAVPCRAVCGNSAKA